MGSGPEGSERAVATIDDLLEPFHESMKPRAEFRIGAEAEKIGLLFDPKSPATAPRAIAYGEPQGDPSASSPREPDILFVLDELARHHGWKKEDGNGPLIALSRDGASVTLEPGAQLELSGAPLRSVHEIEREVAVHLGELHAISARVRETSGLDLRWLGIGFHPTARDADLSWVPKARYGVMRRYLPTKGQHGIDMMRRTATVQANFDYEHEEDAIRKLRVGLRLAPFFTAMFANSPWFEGALFGGKSYRAKVWLSVDPSRQGLVPAVLDGGKARIVDYVEWVLDAPMFLLLRKDEHGAQRVVENTGQTFRDFMKNGFGGERATMSDWVTHVNSMFPEVRLKRTLEVRGADSLPAPLVPAPAALFGGLFYDARALGEAEELASSFTHDELVALRPRVAEEGVLASFRGGRVVDVASKMIEIAKGGLGRRAILDAEGRDEGRFLAPVEAMLARGRCPADDLIDAAARSNASLSEKLAPATL
jgi:glutamate--cysteine ligase